MKMDRLKSIMSYVQDNSIIVDIGTDHGVVPIYLLEERNMKKIIATDISRNSLQKLEDKIDTKMYLTNIETRCCDGITGILPFEVDTVIIAGMGGHLIQKILSADINKTKTISNFILQANTGVAFLRQWLIENGFIIVDETDLYENEKYYNILFAKVGLEENYKDYEYLYGKKNISKKSPHLYRFLEEEKIQVEEILRNLTLESEGNSSSINARKEELDQKLNLIQKAVSDFELL